MKIYKIETGITYWMALEEGTVENISAVFSELYGPTWRDEEGNPEDWDIVELSDDDAKKLEIIIDDDNVDENGVFFVRKNSLYNIFKTVTKPGIIGQSEW